MKRIFPKRVLPPKIATIRARHGNRLYRALAVTLGGSNRTVRSLNRLVREGSSLKKDGKLNPENSHRIAAKIIERAALMADNMDRAHMATGKPSRWDVFFGQAINTFEAQVPGSIRKKIRRNTILKNK